MTLRKWIILTICIFITFTIFISYKNNLNERLLHDRYYISIDESYRENIKEVANYKLYIWYSEILSIDDPDYLILRTIQFVNDSTALLYYKVSGYIDTDSYIFVLKYLFNQIEYQSKEYIFYEVHNDTLIRIINHTEEAMKMGQKLYYFDQDKLNAKRPIVEIPLVVFKDKNNTPIIFKEIKVIKIEDGKLYLEDIECKEIDVKEKF